MNRITAIVELLPDGHCDFTLDQQVDGAYARDLGKMYGTLKGAVTVAISTAATLLQKNGSPVHSAQFLQGVLEGLDYDSSTEEIQSAIDTGAKP